MHEKIKKYRWLIFDADNTLFDYNEAEKCALLKTLDDFEIQYPLETIIETYHRINHRLWMQFEKGEIKSQKEIKLKRTTQLFDALDVTRDVEQFAEDYLFNLSQNGQLFRNAMEVIDKLSNNHQMVIMTNGMTAVQKPRFAASPITKYFEHVIISEEIKHSKPSKEIFDYAFGLMNSPEKHEVLMIGDNLGSDIQGGINYGIDTVWFNLYQQKAKHSATYEVKNLLEFVGKVE